VELNRNFGLDFLRFAAIMLVILAHLFKVADSLGLWGVELFFALSGFLIGKIIIEYYMSNKQFDINGLKNFWKRRWYRTLPNYYLYFVITIVFTFLNNPFFSDWLIIFKSLFFIQNFASRYESFFGVSWSICIEEWFYLLYPLPLIFFRFKNKKNSILIYTLCFISIGLILRVFFAYMGVGHSIRGITLARLDSIAYGTLIAILIDKKTFNLKITNTIFYFGLILLSISIYYVYFSGNTYEFVRTNPLLLSIIPLGFASIIPMTRKLTILPGYGLITNISKWSYSMYLSHIPIIFTIYILMEDMRSNDIGNILSKIVALVICIYFSRITYKYYEKPLTSLRPKADEF
jgi:peptidoglycan/LPS O-acetylase OafA/YrhL